MKKRVLQMAAAVVLLAGVLGAQGPGSFLGPLGDILGGIFGKFFGGGGATELTQIANNGQLVDHSSKLANVIDKTTKTYQTVDQHLKKYGIEMTKLASLAGHRPTVATMRMAWSKDTFGNNAAWTENANGTVGSYPGSVVPLPDITAALGRMAPQVAVWARNHYSSAEITDGSIQDALNVVGDVRGNNASMNSSITKLSQVVYSDSDDDNTDKAIQNKVALEGMIGVQQRETMNRLLIVQAQMQADQERRYRDRIAMDAYDRAERVSRSGEVDRAFSGLSDAIKNYNW